MTHFFNEANASLLAALADPSALLAFDFDGTLAPLTPDRHAAVMMPDTARAFAELCRRRRCAIISGRAREDVSRRLEGAVPVAIIGNHGAEHDREASAATTTLMQEVIAAVVATLPLGAIDIEDKIFSISLHLSTAPGMVPPGDVLRGVHAVLQRFAGRVRMVPGHNVVNVAPVAAATKGDAIRRLFGEYRPAHALFVGDDVTDEDVFQLRDPRLTSVRIGFAPDSAAPYFLAAQSEMDRLLAMLLARATSIDASRDDRPHRQDRPPNNTPATTAGAP